MMMPELLTDQELEDLEVLIRGQFGPQFSEPLIAKIKALNEFVVSLEKGHEIAGEPNEWSNFYDSVDWENDDA
jgi:hypothetical protein